MLSIGCMGTASTEVSSDNVASAVGSGSLNVFSTPMMIALMEQAACNALSEFMHEDDTTVGTLVNVSHLAASVVGKMITAKATVISIDGRKISFEVSASDGDNEIGNGSHVRFIVNKEKFMSKIKD